MLKKFAIAALFAVCILSVGCGGGSSSSPSGGPSVSARPRDTYSGKGSGGASLFRLPMTDGSPVTVKTPAALFFFTTWCNYCKQAMPEIKRLTERARAQGWRVYGIDVNESASQVNGFVQQYNPNFPILLDQQGAVARQYEIKGYPTFILVDANANIIYQGHEVPRNF